MQLTVCKGIEEEENTQFAGYNDDDVMGDFNVNQFVQDKILHI